MSRQGDLLELGGPEGRSREIRGERVDLRLVQLLSQGRAVVVQRLQRESSNEDREVGGLDGRGLATGDLGNEVGVHSGSSEEVEVL